MHHDQTFSSQLQCRLKVFDKMRPLSSRQNPETNEYELVQVIINSTHCKELLYFTAQLPVQNTITKEPSPFKELEHCRCN